MHQKAIKYLDTPTLKRLAKRSQEKGFNRQIEPGWVDSHLDPEGKHVVMLDLPHEHIAGQPVEPHVRLAVILFKVKNSEEPQHGPAIDIEWNEYNLLPVHVMETAP